MSAPPPNPPLPSPHRAAGLHCRRLHRPDATTLHRAARCCLLAGGDDRDPQRPRHRRPGHPTLPGRALRAAAALAAGRRDRASRPPWYAATTALIGPLHHHWPGQPPPAVASHWPQWPAPAIAAPPTPPGSGQPQPQLPAPPPPVAAPQWPQWPAPALATPPMPPGSVPPQPQLPGPSPPNTGPGSPSQGGMPIQQVCFPPSPSPIPAWLTGSSPPPVYTSAGDSSAPTLQFGDPSGSAGNYTGRGHADRVPQSCCSALPRIFALSRSRSAWSFSLLSLSCQMTPVACSNEAFTSSCNLAQPEI